MHVGEKNKIFLRDECKGDGSGDTLFLMQTLYDVNHKG